MPEQNKAKKGEI